MLTCSVEEFTGLVQDRIASEFSRLQYLVSLSNQHAMINTLQPVSRLPMVAMVLVVTIVTMS